MQAWYVIYTKAQKEEFAQFHLKLKNLESVFPRLLLPVFSRRQKRVVPLFPNYLFVRMDFAKEYDFVRWSPGVKCFVCFKDTPNPVEDGVVEHLLSRADPNGIIAARPNLRKGQEVRLCGSSLAGLDGIIRNPPDAKGRVTLLLSLFKRDIEAEARLEHIESSWLT
ncbi:MAG: transcription termination/antitermination protein NusG [Candidatus Binatia bacterium]